MPEIWKELAAEYLPALEAAMKETVAEGEGKLQRHYGMMRYHLGWADEQLRPAKAPAGKRLRPLLCLLSCEACGGDWRNALPVGVALELIHNFSLVHDDIQDRSPTRRHRPTVWKLWGEALAINVGDGLLILAHLALRELTKSGIPPERVTEVYRILDEACLALIEGQFLDISFEREERVSLGEYLRMVRGKTAALMAASTRLGAFIATEDAEIVEHFRAFGENLGFAFQVQDDILGLWGDEAVTGKPVADDLRQRKKTLPIIYAMEREPELARLMSKPRWGEREFRSALELVNRSGAREFAQAEARRFYEQALRELEAVGRRNRASQALAELASFIVEREV